MIVWRRVKTNATALAMLQQLVDSFDSQVVLVVDFDISAESPAVGRVTAVQLDGLELWALTETVAPYGRGDIEMAYVPVARDPETGEIKPRFAYFSVPLTWGSNRR